MSAPQKCLLPAQRQASGARAGHGDQPGAGRPGVELSNPKPLQVTETPELALAAFAQRRYLLIQNQSPFAWRVSFTQKARPGTGLLLLPGQTYEERGDAVPTGAVYVVGELGTAPGYPGAGIAIQG